MFVHVYIHVCVCVYDMYTYTCTGYNACIIAYGQTGSGKTHTMQGYNGDPGVNTRAISELFDIAKDRSVSHAYTIKVTLFECSNMCGHDADSCV
jgi:kinesin family member C2/C3